MTLCYSHRKEDPFVRLDKRIVMDSSISWKAKGILAYAFSRPESWKFYRQEIMQHASDGERSFDNGIKELEAAGYLHKCTAHEKETGKLQGWEWHFFEEPITEEEFKKRYRFVQNSVYGKTANRAKEQPNKKEDINKNEKNNNTVVVFPCLDELEIPVELKQKISMKFKEEEAKLLVKRVKSWTGRDSDVKATQHLMKPAKWQQWDDMALKTESDILEENADYLNRCRKSDGKQLKEYKVVIGPDYILFEHPRLDGTMNRRFSIKEKHFIRDVDNFIRNIKKTAQKE